MQIFHHEQDGVLLCLVRQEVHEHGEKTTSLLLRIKRGQLCNRGKFRQEQGEIRQEAREGGGQRLQISGGSGCMRADVRTQQFKERRVGKEVVGAEAIALQEQEVKASSVGFDFGHQAGFADPCFPAKQGDLASSLFGLLHERAKSGEFRGSTDDLRA